VAVGGALGMEAQPERAVAAAPRRTKRREVKGIICVIVSIIPSVSQHDTKGMMMWMNVGDEKPKIAKGALALPPANYIPYRRTEKQYASHINYRCMKILKNQQKL